MRASVSCQGAGADTIGQIVYKWRKKYTQLVRWICCPISALHGRRTIQYKAGEIHCDCRFPRLAGLDGSLRRRLSRFSQIAGFLVAKHWTDDRCRSLGPQNCAIRVSSEPRRLQFLRRPRRVRGSRRHPFPSVPGKGGQGTRTGTGQIDRKAISNGGNRSVASVIRNVTNGSDRLRPRFNRGTGHLRSARHVARGGLQRDHRGQGKWWQPRKAQPGSSAQTGGAW